MKNTITSNDEDLALKLIRDSFVDVKCRITNILDPIYKVRFKLHTPEDAKIYTEDIVVTYVSDETNKLSDYLIKNKINDDNLFIFVYSINTCIPGIIPIICGKIRLFKRCS